jgi:hypothetical protein
MQMKSVPICERNALVGDSGLNHASPVNGQEKMQPSSDEPHCLVPIPLLVAAWGPTR